MIIPSPPPPPIQAGLSDVPTYGGKMLFVGKIRVLCHPRSLGVTTPLLKQTRKVNSRKDKSWILFKID